MMFHISHMNGDGPGSYQALLVDATIQEIAEAYFKEQKPIAAKLR